MKTTMTAAVAMILLLAACGSDDDAEVTSAAPESEVTEDDTSTTTEAPAPTTTTEAPTTTTETPSSTITAPVEEEDTAPAAGGFSMMNFRYCEIIMTVTDESGNEVTEVWGTPGVDPCSDEAWYAIDPATIQAENDATFVDMNGPRYFVVDGTVDTGDGTGTGAASGGETTPRQFGDVTMMLLATTEATEESSAYVPDLVERTTTWTFEAGTEVYELTDPDGNVYTMQSYSLIEDRTITFEDLPTLGDRLDLPDGWSYSSRVLDEPLQVALSQDGAVVVTDDLRNSYQRNG